MAHKKSGGVPYSSKAINKLLKSITPEEQMRIDYKMMIARKMYDALQRKKWTYVQFAEAMKVNNVSIVPEWLSGTYNFDLDTLVTIQHVLGIHLLVFNVSAPPDRKLKPNHPGAVLCDMFMKERSLTVTTLAKGLGMTRANLSAIINGRAGISPKVAVKLSTAFGNTAAFWLNLQQNYDLWHAERKAKRSQIKRF